jgi:hypothetical protein
MQIGDLGVTGYLKFNSFKPSLIFCWADWRLRLDYVSPKHPVYWLASPPFPPQCCFIQTLPFLPPPTSWSITSSPTEIVLRLNFGSRALDLQGALKVLCGFDIRQVCRNIMVKHVLAVAFLNFCFALTCAHLWKTGEYLPFNRRVAQQSFVVFLCVMCSFHWYSFLISCCGLQTAYWSKISRSRCELFALLMYHGLVMLHLLCSHSSIQINCIAVFSVHDVLISAFGNELLSRLCRGRLPFLLLFSCCLV